MTESTDPDAFDTDDSVPPPADVAEALMLLDQSFIIGLNTEAAPIMLEEYMASMFPPTGDQQLPNGEMMAPLYVGLPNAQHGFVPHLGEQMPEHGAQSHDMGADNLYQPRSLSDMMGSGPGTGSGNPINSSGQNSASFPMSNFYLTASGSDLPHWWAQDPFNQAPIHQTNLTEIFRHLVRHMFYGDLNPRPVNADEDPTKLMGPFNDHPMAELGYSEETFKLIIEERILPTIPEEELFPRIPHKFRHIREPVSRRNQPMIPPATVIPGDPNQMDLSILSSLVVALNQEAQQNPNFDAYALFVHMQSYGPQNAMGGATPTEPAHVWFDHGFMSPENTTESMFLPQGQGMTLARYAEMHGLGGPHDPTAEPASPPRDPRTRAHPDTDQGDNDTPESEDGSPSGGHTP